MVTKKDLVIAILITFCLTFTLFSVMPSTSQDTKVYDPMADLTGPDGVPDGTINMRDIGYVCNLFMTTGTPINWTQFLEDVENLKARVNFLNASVFDLQSRLDRLENKTWHFVTSFVLSGGTVSPSFHVQGEKWRIEWEREVIQSGTSFSIWDENGNVLDYVNIDQLLATHYDAKGIRYVPHGEGSYYIETGFFSGNSINFTIESYH